MIHVCYGLHDASGKYSKFVGTAITSIFENTLRPVTVHILHDSTLTNKNRDKFSFLAGKYNQAVKFYNVDELCPDKIQIIREKLAEKIKERFSIGAFYRLLMKEILLPAGVKRAIYLDADIILNTDISELWNCDLQNYPLAAVPEISSARQYMISNKFLLLTGKVAKENYFCSGSMLFNLEKIDDAFLENGVNFLAENPDCESVDQDILNMFFSENYLKLPEKFNVFVEIGKYFEPAEKLEKKFYHYAGTHNFGLNPDDIFDRLFLENFTKTPFFDIEIFSGINSSVVMLKEMEASKGQWLAANRLSRTGIFFGVKGNLETFKETFGKREDDIFIDTLEPGSFERLVQTMNEYKGRATAYLFFRIHTFLDLRTNLINAGFKDGEDFINAALFLGASQTGVPESFSDFVNAF